MQALGPACRLIDLHAYWNILEHSAVLLQHSACILEHSGKHMWLHVWLLSCTVLYCLVMSCTGSVCVHSLEFQLGTQTDRRTDGQTNIRTCWAASSQLKKELELILGRLKIKSGWGGKFTEWSLNLNQESQNIICYMRYFLKIELHYCRDQGEINDRVPGISTFFQE